MQRLLIVALSAAFLASTVAPALADDYPPCTPSGRGITAESWRTMYRSRHTYHPSHGFGPRAKKKPRRP
ncbi:MAG: hypothetical protein WDM85_03015 [Caulobacteraceae bacterium]